MLQSGFEALQWAYVIYHINKVTLNKFDGSLIRTHFFSGIREFYVWINIPLDLWHADPHSFFGHIWVSPIDGEEGGGLPHTDYNDVEYK